jgi:hypothetical protein
MNSISLSFNETSAPDFGGFRFYVEEGSVFDAADFAEAYGLSINEIDAQDIKSVQNAAAQLNPGNWLEVTFEKVEA